MASSSSFDRGLSSCKYDVFISFRGADTRNNFISHLHDALLREKIQVYIDTTCLPRGEEISQALYKAIEDSKISIVVLSRDYATSRWCLDELVRILKCKSERDRVVLPIFYGVDPSDVRKQKGSYDSAFVKHEHRFKDEMEKVRQWRLALTEVSNLSGWDSQQNRSESELVREIVQVILLKLSSLSKSSSDTFNTNLVGLEERFKKIESILCVGSPRVRVIGIWGMGGIGKTTLAEVVEKRLSSRFDSCFFIDVCNALKRCELRDIEEKLLAKLLKDLKVKDMKNNSFTYDILRRTKVLVVLDNVDDSEQLEKLIGERDDSEQLEKLIGERDDGECEETEGRFGKGSRIIVTSRDKKLLKRYVDKIYEVDSLDVDEATQLFYRRAFGRDSSKIIDYAELSKTVVDYAGGNPLALRLLGSHLHSRSVKEWEDTLRKLAITPNKDVQKVLKISYDALDHDEQSIFLDIACYLVGDGREIIEETLGDGCLITISVLNERSLVTISRGRIWMHDLIQKMAWDIVRQESEDPGQCNRLWIAQDVYDVLKHKTYHRSTKVKGISLNLSQLSNDLRLEPQVFESMENLKLLKIYPGDRDRCRSLYLQEDLKYLPTSLRYLCWENYPMKSLPSAFQPQNLVMLNMRHSKLEKLWNEVQDFRNLKLITVSFSSDLNELPDLSLAPNLERICTNKCGKLCQIPKMPSSLRYLEMAYTGIEVFDPIVESLKQLEYVDLEACERLTSLEHLPTKNVKTLYLTKCKRLFTSVALDRHGTESKLQHTQREFASVSVWNKLGDFQSLTDMRLIGCGISHIPDSIGDLSSLETLLMMENDFERIPSTIKRMHKLKFLRVGECNNLEALPDLPPSLQVLNAENCESLKMISACGLVSLKRVIASGCKSLEDFVVDEHVCTSVEPLIELAKIIQLLCFDHCSKLKQSSLDNILTLFQRLAFGMETALHQGFDSKSLLAQHTYAFYNGNEIPKWFTNQSEGSSVAVTLGMNFVGIAASFVVEFNEAKTYFIVPELNLKTSCGTKFCNKKWPVPLIDISFSTEELRPQVFIWRCHSGYFDDVKNVLRDDALEATFKFKLINLFDGAEMEMKKCGIRIIFCEEIQESGFPFQADKTRPRTDEAFFPRKKLKLELLTDASND